MKIYLFCLISFVFLFSSCSLNQQKSTIVSTGSVNTGSKEEHQAPLTNTLSWATNEYTLLFDKTNKESVTIKHVSWEATKLFFINSEAKAMNVEIAFPNKEPANFRFSQVILPDGTMDGPFWTTTKYELKQFGGYQLIFNESLMQWDHWSGEAEITITLAK